MPNSTVLQIAQSFCRTYALPSPGVLQGSTDTGALQIRELIQQVGEAAQSASDWQECLRRVTWLSVVGTDQGAILTRCPENLDHVITDTFWNTTLRRQMLGPIPSIEWQSRLVLNSSGGLSFFRIANGRIEVSASMSANQVLTMIYKSKNWILDAELVAKLSYTADTDTSIFSDKVMKAGLRAYWLRIKQMPHRLEMEDFDALLAQEASQGTIKPTLSVDGESSSLSAGIMIPIGNWTR